MPIAKLPNNVEMYYEVHGEGEPFVLINGLKSDHTGWAPMLETLKGKFQVILLDNRAIGQTKDDGKPFTIEDMAADVANLMNHLKIESAFVAGHSMGGAIAQVLAHRHPNQVKKLFLCNTFIKFNQTSRAAFKNVLNLYQIDVTRAQIMDAVIPWVFSDEFVTLELRALIHKMVSEDTLWQSKADYERQLIALNKFDSSTWIENITVPTVVIASKADRTALPQESELLTEKTRAVLEILDGGHASAVEQGAAFSDILVRHTRAACCCGM